ncbi:putative holin-like toxin [Staphylococcus simulans]
MTTFEVIVLLLAFGELILNLVSTILKIVEKRDKK